MYVRVLSPFLEKAVTIEKGGAYIFVMRRDLRLKSVSLSWDLNLATIGWLNVSLVAGEQIVTEGFHKLTPGMKARAQVAVPKKEGRTDE